MRIRNDTDEAIVIPPGETVNVVGDNETARTMVKRIPVFVVVEIRNRVTVD